MVKSSKRVRTEKEREASKQERIAREEGLKFKNGERSAWAPKWLDAKMYKAKRWARKNTQTVFILGAVCIGFLLSDPACKPKLTFIQDHLVDSRIHACLPERIVLHLTETVQVEGHACHAASFKPLVKAGS